jgi:hypothetical protein
MRRSEGLRRLAGALVEQACLLQHLSNARDFPALDLDQWRTRTAGRGQGA